MKILEVAYTGDLGSRSRSSAPVPLTPALSRGEREILPDLRNARATLAEWAVIRGKIDLLGSWAVSALRQADVYALKDWGAPIEATLRANARCYNEAAGLLGEELGICELR